MMVETRTGNEEYFVDNDTEADYYERRENCDESRVCVDEASLVFVLDGSASTGNATFVNAKSIVYETAVAIHKLIDVLTISFVQISTNSIIHIDTMIFDDEKFLADQLDEIEWGGDASTIGSALEEVIRSIDTTAPNTWMIVLSDGITADSLQRFAQKRHQMMKARQQVLEIWLGKQEDGTTVDWDIPEMLMRHKHLNEDKAPQCPSLMNSV
ncbi:unnamed protein product [Anisakis simplex]|uniref:VWFA domain-containing protein n=1 Tax=Anisakis simplex TaxID=6269 RepID=A0A0M3K3D0_ANISI|nr:unnamed protein product [Anisakis simplex]